MKSIVTWNKILSRINEPQLFFSKLSSDLALEIIVYYFGTLSIKKLEKFTGFLVSKLNEKRSNTLLALHNK